MKIEGIISKIRDIPDYPKPGIIFKDITPLLRDGEAFSYCVKELRKRIEVKARGIDSIVGIEARGFVIGAALAYEMDLGFVPARKKGKLPYKKISENYTVEYGSDTLEMHSDSISKGENVLIVDDLLATGGTASAVGSMVRKLGGNLAGYAFLIWLSALGGEKKLDSNPIYLIKY